VGVTGLGVKVGVANLGQSIGIEEQYIWLGWAWQTFFGKVGVANFFFVNRQVLMRTIPR